MSPNIAKLMLHILKHSVTPLHDSVWTAEDPGANFGVPKARFGVNKALSVRGNIAY